MSGLHFVLRYRPIASLKNSRCSGERTGFFRCSSNMWMSSGDSMRHVQRWFVHAEFSEDESVIGRLIWSGGLYTY